MQLTKPPIAKSGMLIRAPIERVFEAFVDPAVTTKFWFTRGSARLAPDASVTWEWAMYGLKVPVDVTAFEANERLRIDWGDGDERSSVEWRFEDRGGGTTWVEIDSYGFRGDGDAVVAAAIDSAGGFGLVLAGAKAWLEHGIELELVRDRHPSMWKDAVR